MSQYIQTNYFKLYNWIRNFLSFNFRLSISFFSVQMAYHWKQSGNRTQSITDTQITKKENCISLWNKTATFERSICQLPSITEGVDQTKRTFLKSISTQIYGNNVLVYSKSLFSIFCKTTLPVILTKSVRTSNNIFQKSVLRHNKSSSSNRHFVPENTWV